MSYERLFELRRERLAAGERPLGWKVGFASASARALLGTDRALVGFLTDGTLLPDGGRCSIAGWGAPVLEAELAVRVGDGGGIVALGVAIELADIEGPKDDADEILVRNIFHRRVLLGPADAERRSAGGVTCRVLHDRVEVAAADDLEALNGPLERIVADVGETLAEHREALRTGDVVIAGSVVPPVPARPGSWRVELAPLGALAVRLDL
jgi:2-keto-4-pentenoate hydratase